MGVRVCACLVCVKENIVLGLSDLEARDGYDLLTYGNSWSMLMELSVITIELQIIQTWCK